MKKKIFLFFLFFQIKDRRRDIYAYAYTIIILRHGYSYKYYNKNKQNSTRYSNRSVTLISALAIRNHLARRFDLILYTNILQFFSGFSSFIHLFFDTFRYRNGISKKIRPPQAVIVRRRISNTIYNFILFTFRRVSHRSYRYNIETCIDETYEKNLTVVLYVLFFFHTFRISSGPQNYEFKIVHENRVIAGSIGPNEKKNETLPSRIQLNRVILL